MPFPHKRAIGMVRRVDRTCKEFECSIAKACEHHKLPMRTYYSWRKYCPEYQEKVT